MEPESAWMPGVQDARQRLNERGRLHMAKRWKVLMASVALLAIGIPAIAGVNPVTFQCQMKIQILSGLFNPARDTLVVRGSFNGWAGNQDRLTDPDGDSLYTVTLNLPDALVGQTQYYKYVIVSPGKADRWESDPNREFVLQAGGQILPVEYFDRQEVMAVTAKVTFQADMSELLLRGYFDPATDSIRVVGSFNGWANSESMQPDLFDPTLFVYTTPITAAPGSTQKWKFRAYPTSKFLDNGWEGGSDHTFTFTGQDMTLPPQKPNILPAGRPLRQAVTVRFKVNVRGATDWFNKKPFGQVKSVWLNGDFVPLGQGGWGSWAVADTNRLVRMYDDGTHGDEVANDEIWTTEVSFAAGAMNTHLYKFGIYAAGVDTLNRGNIPMDNEAGFAQNHFVAIDDAQPLYVVPTDIFGSQRPLPEVTFQVDMSIQMLSGLFDPAKDKVVVRGNFNGWAGQDELVDYNGDKIFVRTYYMPDATVGDKLYFKYVILRPGQADRWESDPNREHVITAGHQLVALDYFSRESQVAVTAKVKFQADMSELLTRGWFDPATDSIRVVGSFNGWANTESMVPDLFDPSLYVYEIPITAVTGSTQKWKFRAYPTSKWLDNGWEGGSDHQFTFTGSDLVLPPQKPNISPAGRPLVRDVIVRFRVNVTGAVDWFNKKPFVNIKSVWLNGDFVPLGVGGWGGWAVVDTSQLVRMYDDGVHGGDEAARDNIWTTEVLFRSGQMSAHLYKYGIYADGVDTLNRGNIPLDNEAGFAMNHTLLIDDSQPLYIAPIDIFGSQWRPSAVERETPAELPTTYFVSRNYPNPFNPETTIRYGLPERARVKLTIYNLVGQKIATLVDAEQAPGYYRVKWDGRDELGRTVPSGLYLYRFEAGNYSVTRKMTLMK